MWVFVAAVLISSTPDAPKQPNLVPQESCLRATKFALIDIGKGMGLTLIHPATPRLSEVAILGVGLIGTIVALQFDVQIHRSISNWPDPLIAGNRLSSYVSYLGDGWINFLGFGLGALTRTRTGLRLFLAAINALTATLITSQLLKFIFRMERPSYDPNETHWFSRLNASAMPSGHTMTAFATASILSSEWPKLSPIFYGLATWIALSRVQLSKHWMSNVILGATLGTLFGLEGYRLAKKIEWRVAPLIGIHGEAGFSIARDI